jgi:ferredoxin--NADP+ reductase
MEPSAQSAHSLLNATLAERIDINPELSVFRVQPRSGARITFEPGQYTTLGVAGEPSPDGKVRLIRRAYSIASAPEAQGGVEFLIVHVPEGELTPKLWSLRPGDPLFMDERCKGLFTLGDIGPEQDLIMISTGTGLAPFMSMLRHFREKKRWRRFVVINGVRVPEDLAYREELDSICQGCTDIRYVPMVTRAPNFAGLKGRIPTLLEGDAFENATGVPLLAESCHVFLCGNPDMVESIQATLESRGFKPHARRNPGNIHFEKYW